MTPIEIGPRLLKTVRRLGPEVAAEVETKLASLATDFGRSHTHSGLGLRKIGPRSYEARIGLKWRLALVENQGVLLAYDVLNHDEIRRWLKRAK